MNDLIPICHYQGKIDFEGTEVTDDDADMVEIRNELEWFSAAKSIPQVNL